MKMLDLVQYLRTNILDDTGGQGVDWSSHTEDDYDTYQLRWSNDELVSNINEAIRTVYRRAMPVRDIHTLGCTALKETYKLPTYILKIIDTKTSNNLSLKEVSIDDVWGNGDLLTRTGEPLYYVSDHLTNTIRIYPIPDKEYTITLMVYRLPLKSLDLYSQEDVELKEEFLFPMLNYAAALCYMKDEANVLDPNRSQYFMGLFDREFPFTSSYSTIRKSRTANRPIKYGGL